MKMLSLGAELGLCLWFGTAMRLIHFLPQTASKSNKFLCMAQ